MRAAAGAGGRLMDCLRCGYRRGKRGGGLQSDRLISYASWLDWLQAENMRLIKTHSIFPCCYPKSFLTADHLMGAVSGRAQVVFLSERLSEVCVYECVLHTRGTWTKIPAGRCDSMSSFLCEVRPSADRYEVLRCFKCALVSVSNLGVTTA